MPEPSTWKMPTVSPRASIAKVGASSSGIDARSMLDAAPADQLDRLLQHRERLQAEEVELYQPRLLDPLHVELRDRQRRARIAVERHQLVERPVADDDARGMRRGVAIEPLELHRDGEQPVDDRLLLARLLEARLAFDRLLPASPDWPDRPAPACTAGRPARRAFRARGRRRGARRAPAASRR